MACSCVDMGAPFPTVSSYTSDRLAFPLLERTGAAVFVFLGLDSGVICTASEEDVSFSTEQARRVSGRPDRGARAVEAYRHRWGVGVIARRDLLYPLSAG